MVLFFTSPALEPPATIYVGRDKFENEDLIKYAFEEDVWFHVDKLSSPHVYLRMAEGMRWDLIPQTVLDHLGQLTKAGSIEGNKKKNITIIYTPASNLKKQGDMSIGSVSFHNDRLVRRFIVGDRENAIVNMLNKTKKMVEVDHEAVRQQRQREAGRKKKMKAVEEMNERLDMERAREAERQARDYSSLNSADAIAWSKREKEIEKARARRLREEQGGGPGDAVEQGSENGSDDSFM